MKVPQTGSANTQLKDDEDVASDESLVLLFQTQVSPKHPLHDEGESVMLNQEKETEKQCIINTHSVGVYVTENRRML